MIEARLDPSRVAAAAGSDVDASVVLTNTGPQASRVRIGIAGDAAGWATVEPPVVDLAAGESASCNIRFRLPRGAPGGAGPVSFTVRAVPEEPGAYEASAAGHVEIVGMSQLDARLLPGTTSGSRSGSHRLAVDNLGAVPARAIVVLEPSADVTLESSDDSIVVDPNATEFARITARPKQQLFWGSPITHRYRVRVEPLGGAPVTADGAFLQRSLVVGYAPRAAAALVAVALLAFVLVRVVGGGDDDESNLAAVSTTVRPAVTTTVAATAPPESTTSVLPSTTTSVAKKDRRVAFQTKRDGNFEIYAAAPDGTKPANLTNNPAHDGEPAWSPEGNRIAFDSDRGGTGFDVFVMNADGTEVVQLTHEPANDGYPTWSPDGSRIAFISFRDGNSELYVMNADGTGPRRLTKNLADDAKPAWSPDGTKIAFHSNVEGNYDVFLVNVDGTGTVNVTNSPGSDQNAAWSPDGKRIAFDSAREGGNRDVYVMNADGTGATRVTDDETADVWPAWAPEGRRIIFQSPREGDPELYVVSDRGGRATRFTSSPGIDAEPAW